MSDSLSIFLGSQECLAHYRGLLKHSSNHLQSLSYGPGGARGRGSQGQAGSTSYQRTQAWDEVSLPAPKEEQSEVSWDRSVVSTGGSDTSSIARG